MTLVLGYEYFIFWEGCIGAFLAYHGVFIRHKIDQLLLVQPPNTPENYVYNSFRIVQ